jgi:hypothetical protein
MKNVKNKHHYILAARCVDFKADIMSLDTLRQFKQVLVLIVLCCVAAGPIARE